jgi:O-antigen/teichoic acid export membrane protein
VFVTSWVALALGLLAPWIVELLSSDSSFDEGARVVAILAFAKAAYAAYIVMAIGVGRARRTQFNWVITGAAAAVNIGLNLLLVPPYEMYGSAVATAAAFAVLFLGMTWYAQRVYPVQYQWRRVLTAAAAAIGLTVLGKLLDVPLVAALLLVGAYPLLLLVLGFYLPVERARLRALRL